ncbi:MAG: peroxiredoxin family protein [Woeseiaceae bacterium]
MNTIWLLVGGIVVIAAGVFIFRDKVRGKPVPNAIRPGNTLPEFTATNENGETLRSGVLRDRPSVLLFVRGSWCPFCSKQVANLTKYYKEITDSGARLILITPNPLETTRRVADFFAVDFEFWLDDSLAIGRKLGLVQEGGVPADSHSEYGADTLWPTSLVVDADGVIQHTELSRFIADRPNPERLLSVVKRLQGLPA